jgi:23S rRNA pseudouridine955/2504/2580 synthase
MKEKILLIIKEDEEGTRLDRFIKRKYKDLSQGSIEKALRKKLIRVNDKSVEANYRLINGDKVSVTKFLLDNNIVSEKPVKQLSKLDPNKVKLIKDSIIFMDEDVIVLNKPAGIPVQGGSKVSFSIDDAMETFKKDDEKPKLVHRLDKDTSGLLLIAKSTYAATKLTEGFRTKTIKKIYWAAVIGKPSKNEGKIDIPLSKTLTSTKQEKVIGDKDGNRAITNYKVIDYVPKAVSWLEMEPITGKTHQLRVHAQAIECPILGDGKYGGRNAFINEASNKLHLHARKIVIENFRGKKLEFTAPLPTHMKETWKIFGWKE